MMKIQREREEKIKSFSCVSVCLSRQPQPTSSLIIMIKENTILTKVSENKKGAKQHIIEVKEEKISSDGGGGGGFSFPTLFEILV